MPPKNLALATTKAAGRSVSRTRGDRDSDRINIKEFGTITSGVDCGAVFAAFNTWAIAQTEHIHLIMPPDDYMIETVSVRPFSGIKQLTVSGYGAKFHGSGAPGAQIGMGAIQGLYIDNVHSARINAAKIGDASVTLVTAAQNSRFAVGDWILITAFDLQGAGYYPLSAQFLEYAQISAINTGTGQIDLKQDDSSSGYLLKHYYNTTYPVFAPGGEFALDQGGPATIYKMKPDWNCEQTVYGLHFSDTGSGQNQIYGVGKKIHYIDCVFDGEPVPTLNREFIASGCQVLETTIEFDKCCEFVTFEDCRLYSILCQSSCNTQLAIDRCSMYYLNGTVRNTVIRDSDIYKITLSPRAFGASVSTRIENCRINVIERRINTNRTAVGDFTLSHGTLTKTVDAGSIVNDWPWFAPGAAYFLEDSSGRNIGTPFVLLDMARSGTTLTLKTTLPNALPGYTVTSPAYYQQCDMPRLTVRNCTGSDDIISLSRAPEGLPLYSYGYRAFAGNMNYGQFGPPDPAKSFYLWGQLVRIRINVKQAYTGAASSYELHLNQAGTYGVNGSYALVNWDPIVNLKVAGERVIIPGTTTGTQSGDANLTQTTFWFTGGITPIATADNTIPVDVSAETPDLWAIVEIEILTDQGITGFADLISAAQSFVN